MLQVHPKKVPTPHPRTKMHWRRWAYLLCILATMEESACACLLICVGMGCLPSRALSCCSRGKWGDDEGTTPSTPTSPPSQKLYSWDLRRSAAAAAAPSLSRIVDLREGEQVVKLPGDVQGEQVVVANCVGCSIYIFDHSSQVTIDDCSNSLILLGPVKGSVFLRGSVGVTLVVASSQLRVRDSRSIHLFVAAESEPVIESSSGIVVAPYFLSYRGISSHFSSALLSRWTTTRWSPLYDFTPHPETSNWVPYDPLIHKPNRYIVAPRDHHHLPCLQFSVEQENSFVPVTHPVLGKNHPLPPHQVTTFHRKEFEEAAVEDFYERMRKDWVLLDLHVTKDTLTFHYYNK